MLTDMSLSSEDNLSDDEIFFGKLTINELKKHIMWSYHGESKTSNFRKKTFVGSPDSNTSIKIIESHAEPHLQSLIVNSPKYSSVPGSPAVGDKSDESFIQMEKMESKLCMSPGKTESLELNNTTEDIEYTLNNSPKQNISKSETEKKVEPNFRKKTFVGSPDSNTSIKIIESHAEPHLQSLIVNSPKYSSVPGSPAVGDKSDESFIQMEKMVSKLCMAPGKTESLELNNTSEDIEYTLNNSPKQNISNSETEKKVEPNFRKKTFVGSPDSNTSIKIIESHAEPHLQSLIVNSPKYSSVPGSPAVGDKSDESFIQMEKMVSKLCMSPGKTESLELNNTSEDIEYTLNNSPKQNISKSETEKKVEPNFRKKTFVGSPDSNTSIKIIESHAEPHLQSLIVNRPKYSSVPGSPAVGDKSDESFIQMEKMVSKLCMSPGKTESLELNNTSEDIEYTLNNSPKQNISNSETEDKVELSNMPSDKSPLPTKLSPNKIVRPLQASPIKKDDNSIKKTFKYVTPVRTKKQQADIFDVPSSANLKTKTHLFKTPVNCLSQRKPLASSLKKTPVKTNAYQFIQSPVAFYINNSPSVPLVKNIFPKTPLPGPSSIPKIVERPPQNKVQNKENKNINLPTIAYKSAKNTKVIQIPDKEKLPQSQWAKNVKSCLPQPTIMKHIKREMNVSKKTSAIIQDDSLANMSLLQAEVSVCTQKSAYKTK